MEFYVEPILSPWDEIESKLADKLVAAYIDPSLNGNPAKVAEAVKAMAAETDQLLKEAGLYGTS
jgi:hypothetical protein